MHGRAGIGDSPSLCAGSGSRPHRFARIRANGRGANRCDQRLSLQPKQALAKGPSRKCDPLHYGGAAGGGKSHWLLWHMARQILQHRGYRGGTFHRLFATLSRTIIPGARVMLRGWATYCLEARIWQSHLVSQGIPLW